MTDIATELQTVIDESRALRVSITDTVAGVDGPPILETVNEQLQSVADVLVSLNDKICIAEKTQTLVDAMRKNEWALPDTERQLVEETVDAGLDQAMASITAQFSEHLTAVNEAIESCQSDFNDRFDDVKSDCEEFSNTLEEKVTDVEQFINRTTEQLLATDSTLFESEMTQLNQYAESLLDEVKSELLSGIDKCTEQIEEQLQQFRDITQTINDKFDTIETIIEPVEPVVTLIKEIC